MYNNLPQLGPTRRKPPYRRAPRPQQYMGSWLSEWLEKPLQNWKFPLAAIGSIFGLTTIGSATGIYQTGIGDTLWSGLKSVGSVFYKPAGTSTTATFVNGSLVNVPVATAVPTGILPTVLGVGVPGMGLVGQAGTAFGGLLYTPGGAGAAGPTPPTGLLTTLFGVGVPGGGYVEQAARSLVGGAVSPIPTGVEQPQRAEIILGVPNTNLAMMAGGAALLLLFLFGRRK